MFFSLVCFEIGALSHSLYGWVKSAPNFKTNKFLQAIQSFLYCLSSRKKYFPLRNFETKLHPVSSLRYLLWIIRRHFNIILKKQPPVHGFILVNFRQILSDYKFAEIEAEMKLFQYFELLSILKTSPMSCDSSLLKIYWNKSILRWPFFCANIEMSPYESKEVPKWRYLVEKNFKISQSKHFF